MLVKIIRDVAIKDQDGKEFKLKKGRVVTAEMVDLNTMKPQFKLLFSKNEIYFPVNMEHTIFEIL